MKLYYHPLSGHAHRAHLFLSLAGAAHQLVEVDLAAKEHKSPEFLALNAFGEIPVLDDDGVIIADSNAILVCVARKVGPVALAAGRPGRGSQGPALAVGRGREDRIRRPRRPPHHRVRCLLQCPGSHRPSPRHPGSDGADPGVEPLDRRHGRTHDRGRRALQLCGAGARGERRYVRFTRPWRIGCAGSSRCPASSRSAGPRRASKRFSGPHQPENRDPSS
ncbi:glutathione S-transferase N-terminal domain-containing protein [Flavisphingomonas formosensis]|uniref:glutathione S-transferase N-terminal domain-containing protein n=1 Tax=Flavisphingomonas formosensis TaxID=861534 RepID=UPI001E4D95BC|nr:glutathione S-transferase N-terminal domain-containing protein [Sphingomonas formosensis]